MPRGGLSPIHTSALSAGSLAIRAFKEVAVPEEWDDQFHVSTCLARVWRRDGELLDLGHQEVCLHPSPIPRDSLMEMSDSLTLTSTPFLPPGMCYV